MGESRGWEGERARGVEGQSSAQNAVCNERETTGGGAPAFVLGLRTISPSSREEELWGWGWQGEVGGKRGQGQGQGWEGSVGKG